MKLLENKVNSRRQSAQVQIRGDSFSCRMETDWKS